MAIEYCCNAHGETRLEWWHSCRLVCYLSGRLDPGGSGDSIGHGLWQLGRRWCRRCRCMMWWASWQQQVLLQLGFAALEGPRQAANAPLDFSVQCRASLHGFPTKTITIIMKWNENIKNKEERNWETWESKSSGTLCHKKKETCCGKMPPARVSVQVKRAKM